MSVSLAGGWQSVCQLRGHTPLLRDIGSIDLGMPIGSEAQHSLQNPQAIVW